MQCAKTRMATSNSAATDPAATDVPAAALSPATVTAATATASVAAAAADGRPPAPPLASQQQPQAAAAGGSWTRDFVAGAGFGFTSVLVGQPLETIKTRCQARSSHGMATEARELFAREGVRGLYRGSMPIFLGGTLFRSAQFGVYANALEAIQTVTRPTGANVTSSTSRGPMLGVLDLEVAAAGFCGGIGRGLIEGPFDFVKVRRQVDAPWRFAEAYKGTGVTVFRNALLFCAFSTYLDQSKRLLPGDAALGPFLNGALCANLAWLTIWPLDVVKSQRQSGMFAGQSSWALLVNAAKTGKLYRGLLPGLLRSSVANGCAMTVYTEVKKRVP